MDVTPTEQAFSTAIQRLLTLDDCDARRTPLRRVHALARQLARDMGDDLSAAQQQLVQRAATLAALCEDAEAKLLLGENASVADFLQMANTQRRMLQALGLRRVPKDVTNPIDYARSHASEQHELEREDAS